ncbi:PepSY-associated TM helix domain-containing protein [Promicromonospora vindobonensis]|uniref:PepSY-associated TM helix domain-containing protein n=1 Tax=Promicromonospora vindobonensis TaxID=195748 RepID=A0ABW5VX06_9MICO
MTTTVSVTPESDRDRPRPPGAGRPEGRPRWFGALLLRLHFYAGLLVGPFILVAAVSGALYALTPAIEQGVYRHELRAPVTDTQLTLAEQTEIARSHIGDAAATPSAVRPAPEPGDTTRIMFADEGLGESESRAVFVDPGTGEVRGDLTVYGTSGALPLRAWLDQLHRNLHLGDVGRLYSELAASWLGIVAVAGLGLWIRRIRRSGTKKDFVRPGRGRTGYRRLFTWHTSVGIWVLLGALFLSATGITWSQHAGSNVDTLRAAFDWSTPGVDARLPGGGTEQGAADGDGDGDSGNGSGSGGEHAGHGTAEPGTAEPGAGGAADPALLDAVLATAEAVNINTGLVEITPPAEPGTAWVVQEIQRSYPTEVDAVAVDPGTMQVLHRVDFAEFPLAAKLARWGIDAHMGSLFGLPNQLVLFLLAGGIATMVVLGYLMWWKRRPTREPRPLAGTPPRRGVLRGAPWWGIAAVLGVAVALGWWLPLVGWTLAGFVVADVLVGLLRRPGRGAVSPGRPG